MTITRLPIGRSTVPLVVPEVKDAAIDAYQALIPMPGDPEITRIIAGGESKTAEFKSSARWDMKLGTASKEMEKVIVKTVAAFLNTDGGTLLIGVADNGAVVGIEHDMRLLKNRRDNDGYEQFLTQLLFNACGLDKAGLIGITFHDVGPPAATPPRAGGLRWPVAVAHPFAPDRHLVVLQLTAGGVATSGRDVRRWVQEGQWQHHIIDPRTGRPAVTDVQTATVLADSTRQAEAAAKAALILGRRHGLAWIEARPSLAAVLVTEDGEVHSSRRLTKYLGG